MMKINCPSVGFMVYKGFILVHTGIESGIPTHNTISPSIKRI